MTAQPPESAGDIAEKLRVAMRTLGSIIDDFGPDSPRMKEIAAARIAMVYARQYLLNLAAPPVVSPPRDEPASILDDFELWETCIREAAQRIRDGVDTDLWLTTLESHAITAVQEVEALKSSPPRGGGVYEEGRMAATDGLPLDERALRLAADTFMSWLPNNNRATSESDISITRQIVEAYVKHAKSPASPPPREAEGLNFSMLDGATVAMRADRAREADGVSEAEVKEALEAYAAVAPVDPRIVRFASFAGMRAALERLAALSARRETTTEACHCEHAKDRHSPRYGCLTPLCECRQYAPASEGATPTSDATTARFGVRNGFTAAERERRRNSENGDLCTRCGKSWGDHFDGDFCWRHGAETFCEPGRA